MRIRTERTELAIEVYELDPDMRTATDAELLAEVANRVPIEGKRVPQSDWVVVDRGEDDIELAAAAYREAKAAVERAEDRLKPLVQNTPPPPAGHSETKLADMAGVDRQTIRRWRGKQ